MWRLLEGKHFNLLRSLWFSLVFLNLNQVSWLFELTNKVQLSWIRFFPVLSIWCFSLLLIALWHSHQPSEFSQLEIIFNFHSMKLSCLHLKLSEWSERRKQTFSSIVEFSWWNPRKWENPEISISKLSSSERKKSWADLSKKPKEWMENYRQPQVKEQGFNVRYMEYFFKWSHIDPDISWDEAS